MSDYTNGFCWFVKSLIYPLSNIFSEISFLNFTLQTFGKEFVRE